MTSYVCRSGSLLFINSLNFPWNWNPMANFCVVSASVCHKDKKKSSGQLGGWIKEQKTSINETTCL